MLRRSDDSIVRQALLWMLKAAAEEHDQRTSAQDTWRKICGHTEVEIATQDTAG